MMQNRSAAIDPNVSRYQEMNDLRENLSDGWLKRAALGVLVFWLALHAVWRTLDQTPPRGDQTFYINGAIRALELRPLSQPQSLLGLNDLTGTALRPPVASLALAPWLWLFSNDLHWAGLGAVVWHATTLFLLYLLGKRLFDAATGLLSGVFFISLPLIYDTYIDPEFYFMTFLPLALLCCSSFLEENRRRWILRLGMGLITSLGLLCKWVFAIYLLGPMLFLSADLFYQIRKAPHSFPTRRFLGELTFMAAPVLVAAFWYWYNWGALAYAFQFVSQSKQFTPFKEGWTWLALFHYPCAWIAHNKLIPLFLLISGFLLPAMPKKLASRFRFIQPMTADERRGYFLLLSSVIGTWIYFCVRCDNIPLKYILALQPILAILGVAWIRMIRSDAIRNGLYGFLMILGLSTSCWVHFAPLSGMDSSEAPRSVGFSRDRSILYYTIPVPRTPQTANWPQKSIAETIARLEREEPCLPDRDEAIKPVLVLPDIYFFDWRNCGVEFNLRKLGLEASPVADPTGLLRIAGARYIITDRGQLTRFGVEDRDEMTRNALVLNRLIDHAPQWFWDHFRMVSRYAAPYGFPELQMFRRVKPLDEEEAVGWCEFWISYHRRQPAAWEQVSKLWAMQRNQARMGRARKIKNLLAASREQKAQIVLDLKTDPGLTFYEMLELDDAALRCCAENRSLCAWRAAWELGKIRLTKNQWDLAQEYFLKAWRLQRDRPEILQSLLEVAQKKKDGKLEELSQKLAGITHQLLANNRRPIVYQDASNLLLASGWNSDALWFAFQGFVGGLNRYPNTKPLHTALKRMNRTLSDYETLPLPFGRLSEDLDWQTPQNVSLQQGQSIVFSFLNLDGGVYRLRWKHALKTPSLCLSFALDENLLESKTFNAAAEPEAGEYRLQSPPWGDRLRVECVYGAADFSQIELQRVEAEVSFIDWDGTLNVQGKNYHSGKYDPAKGFSFTPEGDWARLNFNMHSDPRAWDFLRIAAAGFDAQAAEFTFIVRGDGKTDEEISFNHPIIINPAKGCAEIPIPPEIKRFPFMLGIRIQFVNLSPEKHYVIQKIVLCRN